jgi:adenine deaminase
MAEFAGVGIARERVWSMASAEAARVLGADGFGQIAPGARADLLVADGSPLDDGWRPEGIRAVVAGGTLVRSADLDAAIGRELARFEGRITAFAAHWVARFALDRAARHFNG